LLLLIHKWFRYLCKICWAWINIFVGVSWQFFTFYDLKIYMVDRAWFMFNFGESYFPLASPIIEIWIFEISEIRSLKSNNSRNIMVRIFWFAHYCFSCVSEQESIDKKVGVFGGPWLKFLNNNALKKYSIIIKEVKLLIIIVLVSIRSRVHKVSIKLLWSLFKILWKLFVIKNEFILYSKYVNFKAWNCMDWNF
jgi:hypothetical protein